VSAKAPAPVPRGVGAHGLATVAALFRTQKGIADRAIAQVGDDALHAAPAPGSNSIAVVMRHLAGNMLSRWTDFLTTDGEKPWRDRDREFEDARLPRGELLEAWERGWRTLFAAVGALGPDDLERVVTIRSEPQTVLEALLRQVSHYGYHVGQIVYLARLAAGDAWTTLSIPRGGSAAYNRKLGHETG
jgi:hypothetical protein